MVRNLPPLLARGRPSGQNPRRVHGWAAWIVRRALAPSRPKPRPPRRPASPRGRSFPRASARSREAVTISLLVQGQAGHLAIELVPRGNTLAVAEIYLAHCTEQVGTSNLNLPEVRLEQRWANGRLLGVWAVWPGGELPLCQDPASRFKGYEFEAVSPLNPGDHQLRIRLWIAKTGGFWLEWRRERGQWHVERPRLALFRVGNADVRVGRRRVRLLPPTRELRAKSWTRR